jgi:RNA polymerase sigma factor (TIGR02999 family)
MARESPDHTLEATALVHEVYLKLVGDADLPRWRHSRHFYTAAAEAMRRILIDHARIKKADKRGGGRPRIRINDVAEVTKFDRWAELDEALESLRDGDPQAAELVRLKVFAGLSIDDAADVLSISRATAYRDWAYARAWLLEALE